MLGFLVNFGYCLVVGFVSIMLFSKSVDISIPPFQLLTFIFIPIIIITTFLHGFIQKSIWIRIPLIFISTLIMVFLTNTLDYSTQRIIAYVFILSWSGYGFWSFLKN